MKGNICICAESHLLIYVQLQLLPMWQSLDCCCCSAKLAQTLSLSSCLQPNGVFFLQLMWLSFLALALSTAAGFTAVDTLAFGALGHMAGVGIVLGLRATGAL
jgi:hypothetical protein